MTAESSTRSRRGLKTSTKALLIGIALIALNGAIGLMPLGSTGETISYALFALLMFSAIAILAGVALLFAVAILMAREAFSLSE